MKSTEMKAAREGIGLSRTELSVILGVQRQAVARWENGKRAIPQVSINIMGWLAAGFDPKKYEMGKEDC